MAALAEAYPSVEALRQLFDQGASPDEPVNQLKQRLVHTAAVDGKCNVIELVSSRGADLNLLDKNGKSALNLCLEHRRFNALRTLLNLGADPNNATVRSETTLHQAAIVGDARFARLLIDKGAKCESVDRLGDWPIHRATLEENVDTAAVLLDSSPQDVNRPGNRGLTPLHIAANVCNAELFNILAKHGANPFAEDQQERTPLDIVITKQDNYIIDTYGGMLVTRALAIEGADCFETVFNSAEGQRFLDSLVRIDYCYRSRTIETKSELEYCHNKLGPEVNEQLLGYIESDEKIDVNEFVQIIVKAVRNGLVDEIASRGLVPKIAQSVFRHVLMPQNVILLQELMALGLLWSHIIDHIESEYITMYEHSLVFKEVGIRGLVWRNCVEETEDDEPPKVSNEKLHELLASITKLWQLQHIGDVDSDSNTCAQYSGNEILKDPVQTLAVWSILTGRFNLTPHLLRQEQYDIIPEALLAAKILRSLSKRRDIEDVYSNKAEKVALRCEGVAVQALRAIKDADTSQNNILTMEYLRMPLESYGDYNVIDLAARGESSNFVTIDVVQDALDKFWFSDFFFVRINWKMEVTILMGFVPPLMIFVPMMMRHIRRISPSFVPPDEAQEKLAQPKGGAGNPAFPQADSAKLGVKVQKPQQQRGLISELSHFYQIPCVKFRLHVFAHLMFVLLLSFIVMWRFSMHINAFEIVGYLCLLGFFVEEINEMIKCKKDESITSYFSDGWNIIDLTAIFCGLLSFVLRLEFIRAYDETDAIIVYWSLVLLSTTCLVYWIRLLFASVILQSIGPKLKMMALMVRKDFMPFLYILFILMIGFGVVFQALLHPTFDQRFRQNDGLEIFARMFKTTFYIIVGDYGIETTVCDSANNETSDCVHEIGASLVPNVFMVTYIVIMQILLLNVIVAMFSKTIDAINNESKAMWQFEKYDLIQEFFMRSPLPPPLNTLLELHKLIMWLIRKLRKQSASVAARKNERGKVELFLYFLYYQAISFRHNRVHFKGLVFDEEDLDEGGKIIFSQVSEIRKEMKRLRASVDSLKAKRQREQPQFKSTAPLASVEEL